ncbi:MAG: hypothetical protein A4E20_10985 [Nitrospira sp. SG-bin2]|uniref:hypothetical protein n=1 Tax=Nitrospira cf. moscoviensis SBR1015 TaxID=96242 RepID=UPI000A0B6CAF|nr:hypothetical protein [Nitrospira cf. moscoviensis SBR1015]OQW34537.1 MAG: hypothetical protein A4E20_10985 [Nitrospira sp. SG-bin2]
MSTLTSLLLAREAVKRNTHIRYSQKHQRLGRDLYFYCHLGWRDNDYQGYGWDVSKALRPYVPGGDLTKWWIQGRSKQEMLDLFKQAAEGLM